MGTFRVDCVVENFSERSRSETVSRVLVDTGSDYTWLPGVVLERVGVKREKKDLTFVMANGAPITRNVGFAIVRSGEFFTVDEIVFAEEGDLSLLGARTLEGFNARVDPKLKKLVASGPLLAAGCINNNRKPQWS